MNLENYDILLIAFSRTSFGPVTPETTWFDKESNTFEAEFHLRHKKTSNITGLKTNDNDLFKTLINLVEQ